MGNVKAFALLAFGYLLVFAGFYKRGHYATRPWGAIAENSLSPAQQGYGGGTVDGGSPGSGGGGGGAW